MRTEMTACDQFVEFGLIICNQGRVCNFEQIIVVAERIIIGHVPRSHKEDSAVDDNHLIMHQTTRTSAIDELNARSLHRCNRIEILSRWGLSSSQGLASIFTIIHYTYLHTPLRSGYQRIYKTWQVEIERSDINSLLCIIDL